jgi:hypothetical protein
MVSWIILVLSPQRLDEQRPEEGLFRRLVKKVQMQGAPSGGLVVSEREKGQGVVEVVRKAAPQVKGKKPMCL